MKAMQGLSLDLFPTFVKIFDPQVDASLNRAIVSTARSRPEFNDAGSGRNLLAEEFPWVAALKMKFDVALSIYLRELNPQKRFPIEVDAYMFFNYSEQGEFTPPHNHIGNADVVGVYYAQASRISKDFDSRDYYSMPGGLLVLHDPRIDSSFDERRPETAEFYLIAPRVGRMVIHPASMLHSVTATQANRSRVAVVCNFTIDKSLRRANYRTYSIGAFSASRKQRK